MSRHPYTPESMEGSRALRQSSHDDHEPGFDVKQLASILGGSALVGWGLFRRQRFTDLFLIGIGAGLAYRGLQNANVGEGSIKRLAMHTKATEPVELAASMTIERPVDELYAFWQNFENLPRVLRHIESVEPVDETDGNRTHWVARLPTGVRLDWRARLLEERKNELLAWQSIEGSDIYNEGFVTFRPVYDGEATEMHVRIIYRPPAGEVGARIAGFFDGVQNQVVREDLRTFKQLMEAGEMPTTHGQPAARDRGAGRTERLM